MIIDIDTDNIWETMITRELFEGFEGIKEVLDERVSSVFHDYCKASGKHPAYGVESWTWQGSNIQIIQDTTCMGCYSTDSHLLPFDWFLVSREDSQALIKAQIRKDEEAAQKVRLISRKKQLEELRAKAAKLAAELEGDA